MLWLVCRCKVGLVLARTRLGEGEGVLTSSLYTIPTGLWVFQDTDNSRFPPRKSSPLTDDAVASWHGFIMTSLLIMICQFSLAQPSCHFLFSPVELPVFCTSLLQSSPSLRVSRESETYLESIALWVSVCDQHLCENTTCEEQQRPLDGCELW